MLLIISNVLKDSRQVLRKLIKKLFAHFQLSGKLEHFKNFDNKYFMSLDGTGFYNSKNVHCKNCCEKQHRDGSKSYYHNMLAATIVHPDYKEVLPCAPEPIMKRDGVKKNDCEILAGKRILAHLRREHPHLKLTIVADSLYSTGVFIKE